MRLTEQDAYAIAEKFGASVRDRTKHMRVKIYCGPHFVGAYGLSRGSREKSFNYIPRQIQMTMAEAEAFIECTLSVGAFCEKLRQRGAIPSNHEV